MKYSKEQLDLAVEKKIFTEQQLNEFIAMVESGRDNTSPLQKLLYYGGSLLIISALTWLLGSCWQAFGAGGLLAVSLAYFIVFLVAAFIVHDRLKLKMAGSLLFCVAIAVVPLVVYSILKLYDFWPNQHEYSDFYIWIKGRWVVLEICTIAVALPLLLKTKFPFMMFLICFCLWFMSMDLAPLIFGENSISWTARAHISKVFGTVMLLVAYIVHLKKGKDFAFWLYLFGLITLISGFSVFYNDDTLQLVVLLCIHILMLVFAIFLRQPVFMVFGVIGISEFLSRVSYIWFKDSPLFPFSLTLIGVALLASGIVYQKHSKKIDTIISSRTPAFLAALRPREDA